MKLKIFKNFFSFSLAVLLTLGLSVSFQSLLAVYQAPAGTPPTCVTGNSGCDQPLNSSFMTGEKSGPLLINKDGINPWGLIVEDGKVGIGQGAGNLPTAQLHIKTLESTEGIRVISASNFSPFNIRNSLDNNDIFRVDQNGELRAGRTINKDASGNVIIQLGN